jgi:hypothetical protein
MSVHLYAKPRGALDQAQWPPHVVWVHEAVGSNPATPTSLQVPALQQFQDQKQVTPARR